MDGSWYYTEKHRGHTETTIGCNWALDNPGFNVNCTTKKNYFLKRIENRFSLQMSTTSLNKLLFIVKLMSYSLVTIHTKDVTDFSGKHNWPSSSDFKITHQLLDFRISPCFKCHMFSFGLFPGVCILNANILEYSVCSIFRKVSNNT
jgi:hypothetical protein